MKKQLLCLLACLALTSCTSNSTSQEIKPSSQIQTNIDSTTVKKEEKIYFDEKVDSLLLTTIEKEGLEKIVVYEATSYEAKNYVDKNTYIPFTSIYCYQENVTGNEAKLYADVLTSLGYKSQTTTSGYIRYIELNDTSYLVLSFTQGDSKDGLALSLNVYLNHYRYKEWPAELIDNYLNLEIPYLEGTYYYLTANSDGTLYVYIEGLTSNCISEYKELLEENDFTVDYYVNYTSVVYYAIDPEEKYSISFTYDSETKLLGLYISFLN